MIRRLLRLSLGYWSPSMIFLLGWRPLSWLDRWELRNYRRDRARGR